MRIIMVNKYAHVTGGADRQCMSLAKSLQSRGHDVAFLAMASPENAEDSGVFVPTSVTHETRETLSASERAAVLGKAIWNRDGAKAMKQLITGFQPDLVHAHRLYPQLSVAPVVVASRHRIPIVQTLHDYEFLAASPFDASGGLVDRRESRFAYRSLNTLTFVIRRRLHVPAVRAWIAVSDFLARAYAGRGIQATVIPNFAEVELGRPPFPQEQRDGLLFLGALSHEKGILDVLHVARSLPDTRVVIAGRGPLRERVAVEASGLANLEFKGHLSTAAVTQALGAARVVVVPSRWEEPGSLVALEAMAAGTPIVAYRSGGLGEYVEMSGAGLTVPPDPSALAAAVQRLMEDRDLWHETAAAGIEAFQTMFSRESHTSAVLEVYERARAAQ